MTKKSPFEDKPWFGRVFPPLPEVSTTTVLAVGFLFGCLGFTPMIAVVGRFIPLDFREAVMTMAGLFKDGMLLILGFYFAKVVNASQDRLVDKALDAAAKGETK